MRECECVCLFGYADKGFTWAARRASHGPSRAPGNGYLSKRQQQGQPARSAGFERRAERGGGVKVCLQWGPYPNFGGESCSSP